MRGSLRPGVLFIAALLLALTGCTGSSARSTPVPHPRPLPVVAPPTGPRPDTIVLALGTTTSKAPPGPTVQVLAVSTDGRSRRVLLDTNAAMAYGGSEPWALLSPEGDKLAYIEHLYRRNRQRVFIQDLASLRRSSRFYGLPGMLLWEDADVVFRAYPPPYRGISQSSSPRQLALTRLGPGSASAVTTYTVPAGTRDIAGPTMLLGSDGGGIYFAEMRIPPWGASTVVGMWRARRSDRTLQLLRNWPESEPASPVWTLQGGIAPPVDPTRTGIWATIWHSDAGLRERSRAIEELPSSVALYRLTDMSLLATYAVPTFGPPPASGAPRVRFGPPVLAPDALHYIQLRPDPASPGGESAIWEIDVRSSKATKLVSAPSLGRIDQVAYADEFGDIVYVVVNPGRTSAAKAVRFLDRATGRPTDLAQLVSTSAVQHELLKVIGTYSTQQRD